MDNISVRLELDATRAEQLRQLLIMVADSYEESSVFTDELEQIVETIENQQFIVAAAEQLAEALRDRFPLPGDMEALQDTAFDIGQHAAMLAANVHELRMLLTQDEAAALYHAAEDMYFDTPEDEAIRAQVLDRLMYHTDDIAMEGRGGPHEQHYEAASYEAEREHVSERLTRLRMADGTVVDIDPLMEFDEARASTRLMEEYICDACETQQRVTDMDEPYHIHVKGRDYVVCMSCYLRLRSRDENK